LSIAVDRVIRRGWTTEEFIKWEEYRLEMMSKATAPEGIEDLKAPMQPSAPSHRAHEPPLKLLRKIA